MLKCWHAQFFHIAIANSNFSKSLAVTPDEAAAINRRER